MKGAKKRKQKLLLSRLLIALAIGVLVTGLVIAWGQYKNNKDKDRQAAQVQHAANNGHATGDTPSTIKPEPSAFDTYRVPPTDPRFLLIPGLSVKAMIKPLGLTMDNRLAAPTNIFDAGWYNQSPKPGQPGAMILNGHVSSWTEHGVFYELKNLRAGDTVQIERGDGTEVAYKVVKTQIYDANAVDMNMVLNPVNDNKPGLNLITCGGSVTKGTNDFSKRIVVFTEQV